MRTRFLLASLSWLAACCPLNAGLVQWPGNGHWYEVVPAADPVVGITWADAEAAAVARGGYLATITSAEEGAFVYGLASADFTNWRFGAVGPWLGGFQPPGSPEPAGGWQWVTGEAWSYTDWQPATGEPNNLGDEDRLHLYRINGVIGWNDIPGSSPVRPLEYMLEVGPVPEPSSLFLVLVGALLFGARLSRRRA